MKVRKGLISPFFISVTLAVLVTVIVCVSAASCKSGKLSFKCTYYFVCYAMEDNSVSASSISSAVSSYGGAGYILEHNGKYYVTVSCYYAEKDANDVCGELKKRNLKCSVLKIETGDYALQTSNARKCASLYKGNLNTLNSLSTIAYECANALDTGEYTQNKAKAVIESVKRGLEGLLSANENNCFHDELKRLIAAADDAGKGYVYSKDLRKLQIAIIDTVINIQLY